MNSTVNTDPDGVSGLISAVTEKWAQSMVQFLYCLTVNTDPEVTPTRRINAHHVLVTIVFDCVDD